MANQAAARSFHHRMARLIRDLYPSIKCQASKCWQAAGYVCEWDQQQGGKPVSRNRLYCADHAGGFALRHKIFMADLPNVEFSQLETARRDGWRYSELL